MYKVIIVEDDPMVAAINRQYVELNQVFQVAGVFKMGTDALEFSKDHDVHLIILDFYTPLMNGTEFIDRLRSLGKTPAVIMVTSANDMEIVNQLMSRGIIDYLVKPFEYSRFGLALDKFIKTRKLWDSSNGTVNQQDIDRLLSLSEKPIAAVNLAKGLNESTLSLIREFLIKNMDVTFTSEQIAEQVHLSRITIRRYMNYMADINELVSTIDYQTGGRPSIKYRYIGTENVQ